MNRPLSILGLERPAYAPVYESVVCYIMLTKRRGKSHEAAPKLTNFAGECGPLVSRSTSLWTPDGLGARLHETRPRVDHGVYRRLTNNWNACLVNTEIKQ